MAAKRRRARSAEMVEISADEVRERMSLQSQLTVPAFLVLYPEIMTTEEVAEAFRRTKQSILGDPKLRAARLWILPKRVRFQRQVLAALTMGFAVPASTSLANRWTSWIFVHGAGPTSPTVSGTVLARFLRIRSLSTLTVGRKRTPLASCVRPLRHRYSRVEVGTLMNILLTEAST
jgi:hypothetical protein